MTKSPSARMSATSQHKKTKPLMMILGDCLPLQFGRERIPYELTYAGKLQRALPSWQIINRAVPKMVTTQQLRMVHNDLKFWKPDVAIIHSGTADLYPHLAGQESPFTIEIPPIHRIIKEMQKLYPETMENLWIYCISFLGRSRMYERGVLKLPIVRRTPLTVFQRHFDFILKLLNKNSKLLIVLGIGTPGKSLMDKISEIDSLILAFNEVLVDLCARHNAEYIDCWKLGENKRFLQEDSIHLSPFGHSIVANRILHLVLDVGSR